MDHSLLQEVKEEARKDKITKFFINNKNLITAVISAMFLFLVIYFIYEYNYSKKEEKFSKMYQDAIILEKSNDTNNSIAILEKIYNSKSAPKDIKAISSLRLAAAYLSRQQNDLALEIYETIAFGSGYDQYLRELSSVLLSKLIILNVDKNAEKERSRTALIRIKKLINKSEIFKSQLQEQLAILYIKINEKDNARKMLEKIRINPNILDSQKSRILDLIKIAS